MLKTLFYLQVIFPNENYLFQNKIVRNRPACYCVHLAENVNIGTQKRYLFVFGDKIFMIFSCFFLEFISLSK